MAGSKYLEPKWGSIFWIRFFPHKIEGQPPKNRGQLASGCISIYIEIYIRILYIVWRVVVFFYQLDLLVALIFGFNRSLAVAISFGLKSLRDE